MRRFLGISNRNEGPLSLFGEFAEPAYRRPRSKEHRPKLASLFVSPNGKRCSHSSLFCQYRVDPELDIRVQLARVLLPLADRNLALAIREPLNFLVVLCLNRCEPKIVRVLNGIGSWRWSYGHFRTSWGLSSCGGRRWVSRRIPPYSGSPHWDWARGWTVPGRLPHLSQKIGTSCDFHDDTFRAPFSLTNSQFVSGEETGIVVLSAAEHEIRVSFAVDVVESYLHVILGLTFLYFSVCLRLLGQEVLEDGLILSSWLVFQQNWP